MPERVLKILAVFRMTQSQLAAVIGIRQTAVSKYVNGDADMPQSTAMAFQAALGVRQPLLDAAEETAQVAKNNASKHMAEAERILSAKKKPGFTGRNTRPRTRGREP